MAGIYRNDLAGEDLFRQNALERLVSGIRDAVEDRKRERRVQDVISTPPEMTTADWKEQQRKRRRNALSYNIPGYSESNPYARGNRFEDVSSNIILPLIAAAEVIGTKGRSGGEAAMLAQQNIEAGKAARAQQAREYEKTKLEAEKARQESAKRKAFREATPDTIVGLIREYYPEKYVEKVLEDQAKSTGLEGVDVSTPEGKANYLQFLAQNDPEAYLKLQDKEKKDIFENEIKIANQLLRKDPVLASYPQIEQHYRGMSAVWNDYAKQPEGERKEQVRIGLDQALITLLNKLLDPGSVVRESEFARTGQAAPLFSRMAGFFEVMTKGGVAITDRDRQEIVDTAKVLYEAAGDGYERVLARYEPTLESYKVDLGISPERIKAIIGRTIVPEAVTIPRLDKMPSREESLLEELKEEARKGDTDAQQWLKNQGESW